MLIKAKVLSSILLLLLMGFCADVVAREKSAASEAHALMQEFFESSDSPGLAVSVGMGGKIIWSEGMFLNPQHFQQQERYFERLVDGKCSVDAALVLLLRRLH